MAKKTADDYFIDTVYEAQKKFLLLHKNLVKKWTKKLGRREAKQAIFEGIRENGELWS